MRQEQIRALAYLERKGTRAPAESVFQQVAAAFEKLERRLETLGELPTGRRPGLGRWSLQEIVDHLVESHRPAVRQLEAALQGGDPGAAIPAGLQSAQPGAKSWPEVRSELEEVHAAFLKELSRGDGADSPSEIPVVLVVKAEAPDGSTETLEWTERIDWKAFAIGVRVHTLEHLAQIERLVPLLGPPA